MRKLMLVPIVLIASLSWSGAHVRLDAKHKSHPVAVPRVALARVAADPAWSLPSPHHVHELLKVPAGPFQIAPNPPAAPTGLTATVH